MQITMGLIKFHQFFLDLSQFSAQHSHRVAKPTSVLDFPHTLLKTNNVFHEIKELERFLRLFKIHRDREHEGIIVHDSSRFNQEHNLCEGSEPLFIAKHTIQLPKNWICGSLISPSEQRPNRGDMPQPRVNITIFKILHARGPMLTAFRCNIRE